MYAHVYMYMYICNMYIYICVSICIYIYVYIRIYICIYTQTHINTHVRITSLFFGRQVKEALSRIWMSHIAHMNESRPSFEWAWFTCGWVMTRHRRTCVCLWHDWFMCVTWLLHMCGDWMQIESIYLSVYSCVLLSICMCMCMYTGQRMHAILLQHTATHCNTPQHTTTRCNTLQHTATHCNTLQHTATHVREYKIEDSFHLTATHCNNLQHTTTHYNTLQHTATHLHVYIG